MPQGASAFDFGGIERASGLLTPGNIDMANRPRVQNPDGSISTVRSISVNVDGREALIPTVSDDGRIMSDREAIETFKRTGHHLGIFDSPKSATAYAQRLHEAEARRIERDAPRANEPVGDFDFSGLPKVAAASATAPAEDRRSGFARAVDAVTTPMVSRERAKGWSDAIAGVGERTAMTGGWSDALSPSAFLDIARAFISEPVTTARAAVGGFVEGAAQQLTAPLDVALLAIGGAGKAARPVIGRALGAVADAERAIVAARAAGRLQELPELVNQLNAARGAAGKAIAVANTARTSEVGSGIALTGRGAERVADAESGSDVAMGAAQIAGGVIGVKTATPRVQLHRGEPVPIVRGHLPPAPAQITPEGVVIPAGAKAPEFDFSGVKRDPSYVRGVPAEYARREPRGLLPSGPRFVATEAGEVVPLELAGGAGSVPPTQERPVGASATPGARSKGKKQARAEQPRAAVPAAVADFDLEGQPIYSSDPAAQSVKAVPLTSAERVEVRGMLAEMDAMPFTKHTFIDPGVGKGGSLEVVPGGAGASVYQDIASLHGREPGRDAVMQALQKTIDGKPSVYGPAIREVARQRLAGRLGRELPPDAGVRNGLQSGEMTEDDFARFADTVDDMAALGPSGEPGERGAADSMLLSHAGGAVAGALYGGATGDDTQDRITRAAVFGALGAAVPSMLRSTAGTWVRPSARLVEDMPSAQGTPRPATDGIPTTGRPAPRPERPMGDPMAGVDVFLNRFPPDFRPGLREVLERNAGFQGQRRGSVAQESIERSAETIRADVMRRVKAGTAMNAEAIRAHVDALAGAQAKVGELSQRIARGGNTDADVIALEVAKAEQATLLASIMGARSEAGRALAQFRIMARVLETRDPALIGDAARVLRGDAEKFAREFSQLPDDPLGRFHWLQEQQGTGLREKVRQYYVSNILSGLKTHERNFLGNTANLLTNLAVAPASAVVDAARSRITGQPRTVYLDEFPAQAAGAFVGMRRGFDEALFSLRYGVNRSALTQSLSAAEAGKLDVPRVEFGGGGANPLNWPGRALDAADQFFRSASREFELYGLAHAAAKREGLRGDAFLNRVAELRAGGGGRQGEFIAAQADQFARRAVFQEKAGPLVGHLQSLSKRYPELSFVLPFIKTPGNIFRQGFEFSPAGFAMSAARAGGREGVQAQARAAVGSIGLGALAYLLATKQIEVSGSGPADPAARAQLMESGWRPNSIRVGDRWIETTLFQPISVPLLAMSNAFDTWREEGAKNEDTASKVLATTLRTIRSSLDMSFLNGVADLFELLETRSMESAGRYLGRQAHAFTPFSGAQRTAAMATDATVRAPHGFREAFMADTPGLSTKLEPRIDRLGREVVRPGGTLRRAADPFNVSPISRDPVLAELGRLGVRMGAQTARMSLPEGVAPSPGDDFRIRQSKGELTQRVLSRLIASAGYQRLPDDAKREVIERAIERVRAAVTKREKAALLNRGTAPATQGMGAR